MQGAMKRADATKLDVASALVGLSDDLRCAHLELTRWWQQSPAHDGGALLQLADLYERRLGRITGYAHEEITSVDVMIGGAAYTAHAGFAREAPQADSAAADADALSVRAVAVDEAQRFVVQIREWVRQRFGRYPDSDHIALAELGLDSVYAVELADELSQSTGLELDVTILWVFPTVAKLASHLADRVSNGDPAAQAADPSATRSTSTAGNW